MEILIHCPSCFGKVQLPFLETADYAITGEKFTISRCLFCGFKFTNPRPTEVEAKRYYASESYISHSGTKKGLVNSLYHLVRKITIYNKVKLVKKLVVGKKPGDVKLLDYGCGTGNFLARCKKDGFKVTGIEPALKARGVTASLNGLDLHIAERLNEIRLEAFDIITLWHVLEHVQDIDETFRALIQLLTPDGLMVVALPNYQSHDAAYYGQWWAGYDVPRHLYHLSPGDLKRFAHMHGLVIVRTLPMYFDAFYVSILSEKYRGGNILNGIIRGAISNFKGFRDPKKFSSIIYILKDTHRYSFKVKFP